MFQSYPSLGSVDRLDPDITSNGGLWLWHRPGEVSSVHPVVEQRGLAHGGISQQEQLEAPAGQGRGAVGQGTKVARRGHGRGSWTAFLDFKDSCGEAGAARNT